MEENGRGGGKGVVVLEDWGRVTLLSHRDLGASMVPGRLGRLGEREGAGESTCISTSALCSSAVLRNYTGTEQCGVYAVPA